MLLGTKTFLLSARMFLLFGTFAYYGDNILLLGLYFVFFPILTFFYPALANTYRGDFFGTRRCYSLFSAYGGAIGGMDRIGIKIYGRLGIFSGLFCQFYRIVSGYWHDDSREGNYTGNWRIFSYISKRLRRIIRQI